jgi:uroporphyrinogen-III synthase
MAANVLVTRPEGQAGALCAALASAGFKAYQQPMLRLMPLTELDRDAWQRVLDLDRFQHLIFVSGNAVRHGMYWIESWWPQLPAGLSWYAVGDTTARLLESYGLTVIMPAESMSSEGLLALPQLQDIGGERVLIVKGEGGRDTLARGLTQRGAQVEELPCYRRAAPELDAGELAQKLQQWEIKLVMLSSGEGLANFLALISPAETSNFDHITLLVPSERVAGMARAAGYSRVIIAENASDSAMLRALEAWQTSAGE